VEIQKIDI